MTARLCRLVLLQLTLGVVSLHASAGLSAQDQRDRLLSGGLGVSFTAGDQEVYGVGGSVVYERAVLGPRWANVRLYGGGFLSRTDADSCPAALQPCSVSSQIGVGGAKLRVLAPTPFIGPFIEVGVGVSAGSIKTEIGAIGLFEAVDQSHLGLMPHFPVVLGLAFGRRHQHKLSFDYFLHPSRDHIAGALTIGIGL